MVPEEGYRSGRSSQANPSRVVMNSCTPQLFLSQRSFAFAAAVVCHCMFATASGAAAAKRDDMIHDVARTRAFGLARRGARVLPLKLPRHLARSMLARRSWVGDGCRDHRERRIPHAGKYRQKASIPAIPRTAETNAISIATGQRSDSVGRRLICCIKIPDHIPNSRCRFAAGRWCEELGGRCLRRA